MVAEPERLGTGVDGIDKITNGGLLTGGVYVVTGYPGVGKSILGNQLAFAQVKRGGRAVYVTLLAETHARLLTQVRRLSFFDESAVGSGVRYYNAMASLEESGVEGLLRSIQQAVRENEASLVILDGLVQPEQMGIDPLAYRKFLALLQSWVGVVDCTVVLLKSDKDELRGTAEQTMVDGILRLKTVAHGMRRIRELEVTKLRGTNFAEGKHIYAITRNGIELFPRVEATIFPDESKRQPHDELVSSGTVGLDPLVGGGLVRGSTTLCLGSSGAGKTIFALQFLVAGARAGEQTLYYGFYEPPHALIAKGQRLGYGLEELIARGTFHMTWRSPAEPTLDEVAHHLLAEVRRHEITRLVIDGFAAFRTSDHPDRVAAVFSVLTNELSRSGVTTVITDETRELFVREIEVPTQHVSALFHNIVFLRQVEIGAELRRLVGIMKTRDSAHDQRLYEFTIEDQGLRVLQPYQAAQNGLIGGDGNHEGVSNPRGPE